MEKQNHMYDELKVIFSQERLDRYLNHNFCNNSKNQALITYSWNIELSKSLYPSLQILEIALRNSLHDAISASYQTEHWFDLPFVHPREKIRVTQAKESLKKDNKPIEVGRIVAELSFGFWTSLFDVRYEHDQTLWPKILKSSFPFLPKGQRTRAYLSRELNRIRILRNRIFHYEPIWHWVDLSQQHDSIIHLAKSLFLSTAHYLAALDNFKHVHANGKIEIEKKLSNFLIEQ